MLSKYISAIALTGAATTAAGVFVKKKLNPDYCPKCEIKKAYSGLFVHFNNDNKYSNGAALTPPMGWSSWNTFAQNIDENLIEETAIAMKKCGLLDAGYRYVNLDDCWQSSMRDDNGRLQGDLIAFPSGIKSLTEKLNAMGFKVGIYSSNGTLTCEDLPASLGREAIDAQTFAEWGIEYFKYDFCHNKAITAKAPLLCDIIVTSCDNKEEHKYGADSCTLGGDARLQKDKKGYFVSNLDCNAGTAEFKLTDIEKDGEYILTVIFRKKDNNEKFAVITVNSTDDYEADFPATKAWSTFGRIQLIVKLKKGENRVIFKNPIASKMDSAAYQYIKMGNALKQASKKYAEENGTEEKPIVYSICEWGRNKPYKWGAQAGNLWRTTLDIKPFWASVLGIYEHNVKLNDYACVGGWNDPDMLEVGNGKLTIDENKAHFTLWCMMAAPLILGNDIRKFLKPDGEPDFGNKVLQIITNKDLIDIDQDALGIQCVRYKHSLLEDILVKPLENNEIALCLFNKSNSVRNISASLKNIANQSYSGLAECERYSLFDLWTKDCLYTDDVISAKVNPHAVAVFRVKKSD